MALAHRGIANIKGLRATAGNGYSGRYLRLMGVGCFLVCDIRKWMRFAPTPLWLSAPASHLIGVPLQDHVIVTPAGRFASVTWSVGPSGRGAARKNDKPEGEPAAPPPPAAPSAQPAPVDL